MSITIKCESYSSKNFYGFVNCIKHIISKAYGIHIFSSLKISNKNILKNILEI